MIRYTSCVGLGVLGNRRAIPSLQGVLQDDHDFARRPAHEVVIVLEHSLERGDRAPVAEDAEADAARVADHRVLVLELGDEVVARRRVARVPESDRRHGAEVAVALRERGLERRDPVLHAELPESGRRLVPHLLRPLLEGADEDGPRLRVAEGAERERGAGVGALLVLAAALAEGLVEELPEDRDRALLAEVDEDARARRLDVRARVLEAREELVDRALPG